MRHFFSAVFLLVLSSSSAQLVQGPEAPELVVGWNGTGFTFELNNTVASNNYMEQYVEAIVPVPPGSSDPFWRFQGYIVFQLASDEVVDSLVVRLRRPAEAKGVVVADQVDNIASLLYDLDLGAQDSCYQVTWLLSNDGLQSSYSSTMDPFTQQAYSPDSSYCFVAVAFASTPVFTDPDCGHERTMLFSTSTPYGALEATCVSSTTVHVDEHRASDMRIWPVPASDVLHVEGVEDDLVWRLLDLTGRSVRSGYQPATGSGCSIAVTGLPTGTYLLELMEAGSRTLRQLVIGE